MWRLTFSGGGQLVRLSANGCQPHRPNTALIFCAAGYHPGLLRTFRDYSSNFYLQQNIFEYKQHRQHIHQRCDLLCLTAYDIDDDIRDNADRNTLGDAVHERHCKQA